MFDRRGQKFTLRQQALVSNKGRPAGRWANCVKLEEEGRAKLILATFQFPAELPVLAAAAFRVNKPAKKQWN